MKPPVVTLLVLAYLSTSVATLSGAPDTIG